MYQLLIAEDEEYSKNFLYNYIKEHFGDVIKIHTAADGKEAMEKINTKAYDILLADICMPYFSGVDIAEHIQKSRINTITVLISGYEEFEYARRGIAAGIRRYLVKPFDFKELSKMLEEFICELNQKNENANRGFIAYESKEKAEEFFLNLIYGENENKEFIKDAASNIKIPFDLDNTKCDIIELFLEGYQDFLKNNNNYTKDSLNIAIDNIISGFIDSAYVYCLRKENGFFEYIIFQNNNTKINYKQIATNISEILKFNMTVLNEETQFSNIYELVKHKGKRININEKAFIVSSYISEQEFDKAKRLIESVKVSGNKNMADFLKLLNFDGDENTPVDTILEKLQSSHPSSTKNKNEAMEKAVEYIQQNYDKNISREDVAKAVFFSTQYFSRNFKLYTGKSCNEYLLEVRMEKAKEMLYENKYKIYEIAKMVGYENTKYFFRLFKLYTGYTPKEYVQKFAKKI